MRTVLVHHQWEIVTLAALTASILGCGGGDSGAPVASNPSQGASPVGTAAGMAPMSGINPTPAAGGQHSQAAMMAQHGATPAATVPGVPATTPAAGAMPANSAHAGGTANPNALMPSAHGAPAGTALTTPAATPAPAGAASNAHAAHAAPAGTPAATATLPIPGAAHAGGTAIPATTPATTPAAATNPATTTPVGEAAAASHAAAGGNPIAAQPGVIPGQPGAVPGQAGEGAQGPGGASTITGEPGSIEFVLSKLIAMAKSGDYTGIDSIVSEKAKGLAATFREQDLKPTQIEAYKVTFDGLQPLNRKAAGGSGVQFTLKKGETYVQITLSKENGSFKIKEMQIRDGKVK